MTDDLFAQLDQARPEQSDLVARLLAARVRAAVTGVAVPMPTLGRYRVLRRRAQGAMGVIYEAHDPLLDRALAIKAVTLPRGTSRRRLLREARALARVDHPNIVRVFDVLVEDDTAYVAMELVSGRDLETWLAEAPRSPAEIVAAFVAAGRGLAAAHEAGITHGDFKPRNVLVGDDGRIAVADFGLAHEEPPTGPRSPGPSQDLTRTSDGIAGTPAYMAPELFRTASPNPSTDQYAFCIALVEAIWPREFEISSPIHRASPLPRTVIPPAWLAKICRRGTQIDPQLRFGSMAKLVHALASGPPVRRWRAPVAIASGAIALGVAVAADPNDPCAAGRAELLDRYGEDEQQAIRRAFARVRDYGEDTATKVLADLDAYASAWIAMQSEVCRAMQVDAPPDQLDLRMQCLARRRDEFTSIVSMFAAPSDPAVVDRALRIVDTLAPLDTCDDLERLQTAVPLPADPETRARIDALYRELAEIELLDLTDDVFTAARRARKALDAAESLNHAPLLALALAVQARAEHRAGGDLEATRATLQRALTLAESYGLDDEAVGIWLLLIQNSVASGRFDEAAGRLGFARAAAERAGVRRAEVEALAGHVAIRQEDNERALELFRTAYRMQVEAGEDGPAVRAAALGNEAEALEQAGRFEEARQRVVEALALTESLYGPEHPEVAERLDMLGAVLHHLDRDAEAMLHLERALAIRSRVFGETPLVAGTATRLANTYYRRGEQRRALELYRHALTIETRVRGAEHPATLGPLMGLGNVHGALGDYETAIAFQRRALDVARTTFGEVHHNVVSPWLNLGYALHMHGDVAQAEAHYRQAADIATAVHGDRHPAVITPLNNLADLLAERGELDEALALHERALPLAERFYGPDSSAIADALTGIGRLLVERDPSRAVGLLERALVIRRNVEDAPQYLADTAFALAKALRSAGQEPERAEALAREAASIFTALEPAHGEPARKNRVAVEAWLAADRSTP